MTKNISAQISQAHRPASIGQASGRRGGISGGGEKLGGADAAERVVRELIAAESRKAGADRLPELAPSAPDVTAEIKSKVQKTGSDRRQQWQDAVLDNPGRDHLDRISPRPAAPTQTEAPARAGQGKEKRRMGLPGGLRLGRGSVMVVLLALLVAATPVLVLAVVMWLVVLAVVVYLTVGHDRIVEISVDSWRKFEARSPKRAEALRAKADALALKWDIVLDRLPESWAERLAFPDVSGPGGMTLQDAPDPFERLAEEARKG
jgi:hypothetical protein